ncbi:MAG: type 4a pilus biogenesis protein PilO [bacterium]
MKKKGWVYNLILLTILLIGAQSYYLYATVTPSIEDTNQAIQDSKTSLATERARLAELQKLNEQKTQLTQYLVDAEKALPIGENKTSIPFHVYSVAEKSGIAVTAVDIRGSTTDKKLGASYVTAGVTLSGKFESMLSFLSNLSQSNRITTVQNLSISAGKNDLVDLTAMISFYYVTPPPAPKTSSTSAKASSTPSN